MSKGGVVETDVGIQGEEDVAAFDVFQRSMRDGGWIETKAVLQGGIVRGPDTWASSGCVERRRRGSPDWRSAPR